MIISLYNPSQVVLYGEFISRSIVEDLVCSCKEVIPQEVLPEILAINDFDHDFAIGVQSLALEALEFKLRKEYR